MAASQSTANPDSLPPADELDTHQISNLKKDSADDGGTPPPQTGRKNSRKRSEPMDSDSDDSDGESGKSEKKSGRRKINIEFIEDKSRRHITFSKRKSGIMKKAYELSTLTGTQVLLLVASETGHVYTFATPKLQPLITKPEGKNLIQACLNTPDGTAPPEAAPLTQPESMDKQQPMPQSAYPQMPYSYGYYPSLPPNYMTAAATPGQYPSNVPPHQYLPPNYSPVHGNQKKQ